MLRRIALAAALLFAVPAQASDAPAPEGPNTDNLWGLQTGLMAGVTVMHAVQPIAAGFGEVPWTDKYYVSISGSFLYGATFVGHVYRQKWSLYIAIFGPVSGFTTVMTTFALGQAGVIDLEVRPDVFQMAGGVLQIPAAITAVMLLKNDLRWSKNMALVPTTNGAAFVARF